MRRLFVKLFVIVYSLSIVAIFLPSVIPDRVQLADQRSISTVKKNRE